MDVVAQYNAGNREPFCALVTDPFMMNQGDPTLAEMSPADVQAYDSALAAAMPDIQMNPAVLIAQGDWVATHLTWTGTFTQPFSFAPFGPDAFPANNQAIAWTEMYFLRFTAEGLVDVLWLVGEPILVFGQMGLAPPPETARTGTPLEGAAGYQILSADELAASFSSGREARNLALFGDMIALALGGDNSEFYADPYHGWADAAARPVRGRGVRSHRGGADDAQKNDRMQRG